jgi:hypothetical protein
MSFEMTVDFFGVSVRAQTEGRMVCVNDLVRAGNQWRSQRGLSVMNLQQLTGNSVAFKEFAEAASRGYDIPQEEMLVIKGKGSKARTMCHFSLAVFVAEQLSPDFHVQVIKTFIEGKLLEFREQGGTEFKNLNAAIDLYLPDRVGKENRGCYINAAKILRKRLLGVEEGVSWDSATVAQTHTRYELETMVVRMLAGGFIKDWEQLKTVLEKL